MSSSTNSKNVICSNWVALLGINIGNILNFQPRVSDLYKSAARHLNALLRLKSYLTFETRKELTESFIYSNFNYCPIVWTFTSAK